MNSFKNIFRSLKRNHTFSPIYNFIQWHFRGKRYSEREISECYGLLYEDIANLILDLHPMSVLEFGCGDAYLLCTISSKTNNVSLSGCDFSKNQIKNVKFLLPNANFDLQNITATNYQANSFDVSVGLSVLMYLNPSQLTKALSELRRISRKVIAIEMSCKYFDQKQKEMFNDANDGRYDYNYSEEFLKAGFVNIEESRCDLFWDSKINHFNEMGYSIITADAH